MLVGAALGAVQAVMLIGVTESPQTLYKNGDKELARKTLARLRGTGEIEEEFDTFGSSETGNGKIHPYIFNPFSILCLELIHL